MNKTVQVHGRLVYLQETLIVKVLRVGALTAHNHLHSLADKLRKIKEIGDYYRVRVIISALFAQLLT